MPRTKAERIFADGKLAVKTTWKEEDKPVTGTGTVTAPFSTPDLFKAFVANLTGNGEPKWDEKTNHLTDLSLKYVWDTFLDGLELDVKSYIRPSSVGENPWIVKAGEVRVNMATGEREKIVKGGTNTKMPPLPIAVCVNAVNNGYEQVHMLELPIDEVAGNFVAARKILIRENRAVAVDEWTLKVAEPTAPAVPTAKPNGKK